MIFTYPSKGLHAISSHSKRKHAQWCLIIDDAFGYQIRLLVEELRQSQYFY